MSEYQFYEFRVINRQLSSDELAEIAKISSRAEIDQFRAKFVYNYSDFPADPKEILAKYFDAMIYLANWGTKQLMFRFPVTAVNIKQIRKYCFPDRIALDIINGHVVLDMSFYVDEPNYSWLEGEGWLSGLLSLRQNIMMGDYRLLYLAWLRAVSLEFLYKDVNDEHPHPPVPPGLKNLSEPLLYFVESFDLDIFLVREAANFSYKLKEMTTVEIQASISKLTPQESLDFLLRLALNEPDLSTTLILRLKEFMTTDSNTPQNKPPTISELFENARISEEQAAERQRFLKEEKRREQLEAMKEEEPRLWEEVEVSISRKQAKGYDIAVEILLQLRELAEYKGKQIGFQERINKLHRTYSRLPSLRHRMESAGLRAF